MRRLTAIVLVVIITTSCATPSQSTAAPAPPPSASVPPPPRVPTTIPDLRERIDAERPAKAEAMRELEAVKAEAEATLARLRARLDDMERGNCAFYWDPADRPSR